MSTPYTLGIWTVKPGSEEDFVRGWREFAEWTRLSVPESGPARLLQDPDQPNRFVGFSPWESMEAIKEWRELDGFKQRLAELKVLLESFEPLTLEVRVEVG